MANRCHFWKDEQRTVFWYLNESHELVHPLKKTFLSKLNSYSSVYSGNTLLGKRILKIKQGFIISEKQRDLNKFRKCKCSVGIATYTWSIISFLPLEKTDGQNNATKLQTFSWLVNFPRKLLQPNKFHCNVHLF